MVDVREICIVTVEQGVEKTLVEYNSAVNVLLCVCACVCVTE